jgi:glycerophosphoryl diester phosphodiesterase
MKPKIIAHRGFSGIAPENTMAAFKLAADLGVDFIELDIHQTKDGVIVCHHDENLKRICGIHAEIKDISFSDLKKADAGSWFDEKFKDEPIPTLEEVISLGVPLLIEIKKGSPYYPGIEKNLVNLLGRHSLQKSCILQSFESEVLDALMELTAEYELHKLVTGDIPLLPLHIDHTLKKGSIIQYSKYKGVNPNYRFLSSGLVDKIHCHSQRVFTWTVNEKEQMQKVISFGVDGIITDYPDKLKSLLYGQ